MREGTKGGKQTDKEGKQGRWGEGGGENLAVLPTPRLLSVTPFIRTHLNFPPHLAQPITAQPLPSFRFVA